MNLQVLQTLGMERMQNENNAQMVCISILTMLNQQMKLLSKGKEQYTLLERNRKLNNLKKRDYLRIIPFLFSERIIFGKNLITWL